jgi:hypothetical protein
MIHNLWHSMTIHDSQPLAHHSIQWFTTSGSELHTMTHKHWLRITHHVSKVVVNHDVLCWVLWLWIMVCYAEPVVVNHGLLCWASGCESWCVILSQWLWVMVCNSEPEVVNHCVLWWASGCESWIVMLCQRLWIMVNYAEAVVVNHGVVCWSSGCDKHLLSITHHDSHSLSQHYIP